MLHQNNFLLTLNKDLLLVAQQNLYIDRKFVGIQQLVLKRVNLYKAEVDGLVGPATRYAVEL